MRPLISLTLWRSANGVRCELVEQRVSRSFEVRLLRGVEVLKVAQVSDTDTAYRVATAWRSEHRVLAPIDAQPLKAAQTQTPAVLSA
jgi:heme-degrading monooxygenase HmoA